MVNRAAAAALLATLALAACGDEEREGSFTSESGTGTETTGTGTTGTTETEATTTPGGGASQTLRIGLAEFKLRPAGFSIAEPGTVEFAVSNTGQIAHALEVEGPTGEVETEDIAPGDSARLTADVSQPGEYKLYCPIGNHEDQGMVGKLVVGGGGSSGGSDDDSGSGSDDSGSDDTGGTESGGGDEDTGGAPSGY